MNLAEYEHGLAVLMTSRYHVDCVMKRDAFPQKMHSCTKNIRGISRIQDKTTEIFAGTFTCLVYSTTMRGYGLILTGKQLLIVRL